MAGSAEPGAGGGPGGGSDPGPVIGLSVYQETASWGAWNAPASLLPQAYLDHVSAAGAIPVMLPVGGGAEAAAAVVRGLDGLIITGGPDVDPARYDAEPHPDTDRPRKDRDGWETALLAAAMDADLPVLGICRGLQVMNVALGGTLKQHLPDEFGDRHREEIGRFTANVIDLDPAAPPGRFLGPQVIAWCHHHQAIDKLGEGLYSSGNAADGVIEAVWLPARKFVVGVQWHPEEDSKAELFQALTRAASKYRAAASAWKATTTTMEMETE